MVSNKSLEVNAALAEGAKQATFEKEPQTPSGTGTRASPPRPHGQPAETPAEQNGSGKTPQRSLPTSSAQPNGNQLDLEGQNAVNKVMLSPEGSTLAELKALTTSLFRRGVRTFSLTLHSPSVEPGCTPYVRTDADLGRFIDRIVAYCEFFFGELGGVPCTPEEFRTSLDSHRSVADEGDRSFTAR